ncbi:MAG: 1-acyl-sn-glycerol-3-phosphate acyltransferase [Sulfobacillus benefaciens]|uniref:1-acyl-sn-glycerol-3-phosphate acyltransferase n=1 Tax=Sulfobacillus benefaciens TaxID=453960 RepID=A0A2T2XG62_9FIRM|nr:MAG: 1-acyl-sn-glycerol-3-phosphate acyltransferase [Sulfobacillus benefaciens]
MIYYWVVYWIAREVFSLYCRIETTGLENVPRSGALMIALNHKSLADPPMAATVMPRRVYFMAKAELFRFRPFGWLIASLGAYPVHRGHPDRKAIRRSLEILSSGQALMIFPEGHRSETGELQAARAGVVYLAQKTNCWVLPVGISGEYGFRKTIRYSVGKPFRISPDLSREEAQLLVMQKIAEQIPGATLPGDPKSSSFIS